MPSEYRVYRHTGRIIRRPDKRWGLKGGTTAIGCLQNGFVITGDPAEEIVACYDVIKKLLKAAEGSGYQVEKLLEAAK